MAGLPARNRPCGFLRQVFFCKYNDPLYVKMEKLEIMIRLASDKNIDQVRAEQTDAYVLGAALVAHQERIASCVCSPQHSCTLDTFKPLPPHLLLRQVLLELKEYAQEVDVDFVRKWVHWGDRMHGGKARGGCKECGGRRALRKGGKHVLPQYSVALSPM